MREKLLFDASSIIYALKLKKPSLLHRNYTQWLTIYEVVNALWKEATIFNSLSPQDARKLVRIFREVVSFMEVLSPHPYEEEILSAAKELRITAYDASYIILSRKNNLMLVTEDEKLRRKASRIIKAAKLGDVL